MLGLTILWIIGKAQEKAELPIVPPAPLIPAEPEAPSGSFTVRPTRGEAPLTVRFDGSGSTADGEIVSFGWDFGDGDGRDTGARPTTRHTYRGPGRYRATLTVTDGHGATDSATRTITVAERAALPAPAGVTATPDEDGVEVEWEAVEGAASYTVHWRRTDAAEPAGEIEHAEPPLLHRAAEAGVAYQYAVAAVGAGGEGTLSAWVEAVRPLPNTVPRAAFTVTPSGDDPLAASFDASTSEDADGRIVEYAWSFGDGGDARGMRAEHAYAATGRYTVTLAVTDDRGATARTRRSVSVAARPVLPAPDGVRATAGRGAVTVAWSAVPGADSYTLRRAVGADPLPEGAARIAGAASPYVDAGLEPGVAVWYWVAAVDTRGEGALSARAGAVPVAGNRAPVALFTYAEGVSGVVAFDGSASHDPDGDVPPCAWSFGDGAAAQGARVEHRYAEPGAYTVVLTVTDVEGATSSAQQTVRPLPPGALPPDPAAVAPAVDPAVASDIADDTSFLYSGPSPVQTGVVPGTIDRRRAAVLRGRVLGPGGEPAGAVRVSIAGRPEYGATLTRADGLFDLALNGGGEMVVEYRRDGLLPAQRHAFVPWREFTWVPDVVLMPRDGAASRVLSGAAGGQVARGSRVEDADGARQATLFFPGGVGATALRADGTRTPLAELTVRATEYTVGPAGPATLPGELPPTSGYTYAVELSVDEAEGASAVEFDRPVVHYVENFLGFPVGGIVPSGYYDAAQGAWVPAANGRVVAVLGERGGVAELDVDGSGKAARAEALAELGVTGDELRHLAATYRPGQSLWRVPLAHLTPWDFNWPFGPPPDARKPSLPPALGDNPEPRPSTRCGSVIEVENQALGEGVEVEGTSFSLHYHSARVPGRRAAYTLEIPLPGADAPRSLRRVEVEVQVAGQRHAWSYADERPPVHAFTWDGRDAYGRALQGSHVVRVRIGYAYGAVYQEPAQREQSFAQFSGVSLERAARQDIVMWVDSTARLGGWDSRGAGLGGWSLDVHHTFDPGARTLYQGDGTFRTSRDLATVISTVAGTGEPGFGGDGGPATGALLSRPTGAAVAPDGTLYIADTENHRVRRVARDGTITTLAGTGEEGFGGDGGPAARALLSSPDDLGLAPDGSVYISDQGNHRVRRVAPDGTIATVAGTGEAGFGGDGGAATRSLLEGITAVVVQADGTWYLSELVNMRIRKVTPDGIITTVAGSGAAGSAGDGGRAVDAELNEPVDVALFPDGSFLIADNANHRIRRVAPDGIITTVVGTGDPGDGGDGGPAAQAQLNEPVDVVAAPDGSWYIADAGNHRIRRVAPDGTIATVAGTGEPGYEGDGGPAREARLRNPSEISVAGDGTLYVADADNHCIRRISPALAGVSLHEIVVPSGGGGELFVFDASGRHLRTVDALTGIVRWRFAYDEGGRLASATDVEGGVTRVERDRAGAPAALVAPGGERTELAVGADGYLARVGYPGGEAVALRYHAGGLLAELTDLRGFIHRYQYDALGRLSRDEGTEGGWTELHRTALEGGYKVAALTATERVAGHEVYTLPQGGSRRVTICCGNGRTVEETAPDGTVRVTHPDGLVQTLRTGPDPRFGTDVSVPREATVATPAGRALTARMTRDVEMGDPRDPLTLRTLTDRVEVNGREYLEVYDAEARTVTASTPEGRVRMLRFDERGRLLEERSAEEHPTTYAYEEGGSVVRATRGERVSVQRFDAARRLESVEDPLGRAGRLEYEGGRLSGQHLPGGERVAYSFDAHGNLTSLTPPERPAHRLAYDGADQLVSYLPPEVEGAAETRYSYDPDGLLARVARPDGTAVELGYDGAGRLASVITPRGRVEMSYAPDSPHLVALAWPGGSLAMEYDGPFPVRMAWEGEVSGTVEVGYDDELRVGSIAAGRGDAWELGYDGDGLLVRCGPLELARDPADGRVVGTTLGGVETRHASDAYGEPTAWEADAGGTPLFRARYRHDAAGRLVERAESTGGPEVVWSYRYHPSGALAEVLRDGAPEARYEYDPAGNRVLAATPAGEVRASYDARDRLLAHGGVEYAYSRAGDLVSAGGMRLRYGAMGELEEVVLEGGRRIEYLVDGLNRRIGKRVDGVLAWGMLYGAPFRPVAMVDARGETTARFGYGMRGAAPDVMERGDVIYRLVKDYLGSVRLVVDAATGEVAQRLDYDAFGRVVVDTRPGFQPFGFAGGVYDPDTGLVRFGARDYDPAAGRWTTPDPLLFGGGDFNLYRYVVNDPVNLVDPLGLAHSGPPAKYRELCTSLLETIRNIQKQIVKRRRELEADKLKLPGKCKGDKAHPKRSRRGHERIINELKRELESSKSEYLAKCGSGPPKAPATDPASDPVSDIFDWEYWEEFTGLTGIALYTFVLVYVGSRLYPPRNLLPI